MLGIGIAANGFHLAANAGGWRIAASIFIGWRAVNLLQLRVVYIRAKSLFHCLIVNQMPTVAGLLLFAEEPQAILAKRCGIKVYRYETQDEEDGEMLDLSGGNPSPDR
jgi:hypothetical protein